MTWREFCSDYREMFVGLAKEDFFVGIIAPLFSLVLVAVAAVEFGAWPATYVALAFLLGFAFSGSLHLRQHVQDLREMNGVIRDLFNHLREGK